MEKDAFNELEASMRLKSKSENRREREGKEVVIKLYDMR